VLVRLALLAAHLRRGADRHCPAYVEVRAIGEDGLPSPERAIGQARARSASPIRSANGGASCACASAPRSISRSPKMPGRELVGVNTLQVPTRGPATGDLVIAER